MGCRDQPITYLDRTESGAVTGSHVLIASMDSIRPRKFTELLVHVVSAGARVISEPDSEVLHLERFLFVDLEKNLREEGVSYDERWMNMN